MILTKLFAAILIALGAPLEAYYYWYSFTKEGVPQLIAWIAAAGLIMLLNSCVYLSSKTKKGKRWYVLAFFVAAFSVISTSAGQDFATLSLSSTEAAGNLRYEQSARRIADYGAEIERLDEEYEGYVGQLAASIATVEDQAKWRSTVASIKAQQNLNRTLRAGKAERLAEEEALLVEASEERTYGLYEHYSSLTGGRLSPGFIQFWKHLWLSLLLMLMAPTGIKMWGNEGNNPLEGKKLFQWPWKKTSSTNETKEKPVVHRGRHKAADMDVEAWDKLDDPSPLRAIAKALRLSHPVLYHAVNDGELQGWGEHPVRAYKKDVEAWLVKRLKGESNAQGTKDIRPAGNGEDAEAHGHPQGGA